MDPICVDPVRKVTFEHRSHFGSRYVIGSCNLQAFLFAAAQGCRSQCFGTFRPGVEGNTQRGSGLLGVRQVKAWRAELFF